MPGVEVAVEAQLAGLVVIERGGAARSVLDEREALATLLSNCEDAYGFPPYSAIEGFLRWRNGTDLGDVERAIVAHALSGLPATLMRSETMDWWSRLPGVVSDWNGHAAERSPRSVRPSTLRSRASPRPSACGALGRRLAARPRIT